MSLNHLDIATIALYFVALLLFGLMVRRIRGFSDYSVGSREVPTSMIFASLSAAYIGPGYTMGFCGKGFTSGYFFFFVVLAFTLQTVLVGLYLAPRLRRYESCHSIGDVLGCVYGKSAQLVSGAVSTVLCIGLVAVIGKVGGTVLHGATGIPFIAGIFIITGVGVLYSYTGGIKSVIVTEALQFALFAITVPILIYSVLTRTNVDLSSVDSVGWERAGETLRSMPTAQLIGLILSFLLGETLIPPYANRALASRTDKVATAGFVWGALYSVLWFGMVVGLGVVASVVMPEAKADDAFMSLAGQYLPHGLLGLLVVAIIAIIMSSHESILNAGAVSFTRDILEAAQTTEVSDSQRLRRARISTLGIGIIASIVAIAAPSVIDGLLIIYSLWAPSVLPALVIGLVAKRPCRVAATPAIIAGALVSLVWQFALNEPGQVPSVLAGLGAHLTVYVVITLLRGDAASKTTQLS